MAVRAGSLRLDTTRYPNSNPANRTHTSRIMASGWGSVTKIVDASDRQSAYTKNGYLYALTPRTGSLARYKVTESTFGAPRISPSGTRTGYAGVRSLALAYRYREGTTAAADVLIATTSAGKLYLITVPVTATFAPRWTLLRASTWTFDDIVVGGCQGHYSLIAVRRSTQRAALYRLDTIAGTSSVIRSYGAISGTWASVRSSARWYTGSYPTRW